MAQISVTLLLNDEHMGLPVELSDGSKFPRWLKAWATVDETPLVVELTVEDGRPVLTTLMVGRPSHTAGALKASTVHGIPVDQVVRKVVEDVGRLMERVDGQALPDGSGALKAYGRRVITDELLREVAEHVRGDPHGKPNQAVARNLHTSSRNASRWISAAKERGFLSEEEL